LKLVKFDGRNFNNPVIVSEKTRRRAQLPEWYYYPPFGQPRKVDITRLRDLAEQPWISLCVTTLIDKFASLDWDIVPKNKEDYSEDDIKVIKNFLMRPNENGETIHSIMKKWARDLLEIDAGAIVKVFDDKSYEKEIEIKDGKKVESEIKKTVKKKVEKNIYYKEGMNRGCIYKKEDIEMSFNILKPKGKRELKEIYSYDGGSFQCDTDVTGFIYRWFQYSFRLPKNIPNIFDKDEICYSMRYPRSDRPYGWSVIQSIEKVVLTLKSQVDYFLGFFKEKGIPEGILSILDSNKAELERLAEHWKKETMGRNHKLGIISRDIKFTNLTVTSKDMEVLTTQQWFAKMVMAMFKLNIPILSLRGEAPKAGLESLRTSEMADALKPLMQEWDALMDNDIIPEILQIPKELCKYEWKFDMYDLETDERTRTMQREDVKAQILTINEVREEERGLEPVSWGDEPINVMPSFNSFAGQNQGQGDSQGSQKDKDKRRII